MPRIAFLTCHLTGTGHLVRTLNLARAAERLGHETVVLNGGRALDHVDASGVPVIQLPAVTVKGLEFNTLRKPNGALVDPVYMHTRATRITDALNQYGVDALVTELFPLGRRVLRAEFLAAIAAARARNPRVAILCSVRDVPEPKPKRLTEAIETLRAHFNGVLVHGDAAFLPLDTTWPLPSDLPVHHCGYLGQAMPAVAERSRTVLVSAGGGVLGRRLLEIAAKAAALSSRPWHILVGGADAPGIANALQSEVTVGEVTIQPARPDYRDLLAGAGCSISLCGYNTAVELADCRTPALLVPSDEADEKEQTLRAGRLANHPGIEVAALSAVSPQSLAAIAEGLATAPRRPKIPLLRDDGQNAIRAIEDAIGAISK